MARKWVEQMLGWDPLDEDWYTVTVQKVTKCSEPRGMIVELLFLENPHAGRVHEVFLSVPARPAGPTVEFVRSTGLETPDGTFAPRGAIGRTIKARFAPSPDGAGYVAVSFEPIAADTPPATDE